MPRRLFAIDVSGGIMPDVVRRMVSDVHLQAAPNDFAVSFDTHVHELGPARGISAERLFSGGGTSAQPVIDYAAERGFRSVRFFSDGYFGENRLDPKGIDLSIDLFRLNADEQLWWKQDAEAILLRSQMQSTTGRPFKKGQTHVTVKVPGFHFLSVMRVNRIIPYTTR